MRRAITIIRFDGDAGGKARHTLLRPDAELEASGASKHEQPVEEQHADCDVKQEHAERRLSNRSGIQPPGISFV